MESLKKEDEWQIVERYLSNAILLKSFARNKKLQWLERASQNLTKIFQEQKENIELEQMEIEELERKRQEKIAQLKAEGWSINDLLKPITSTNTPLKTKSKTKRPRQSYSYPDSKGNMLTWSGFGRMPKILQELLNNGRNLDEFAIVQQNAETNQIVS